MQRDHRQGGFHRHVGQRSIPSVHVRPLASWCPPRFCRDRLREGSGDRLGRSLKMETG